MATYFPAASKEYVARLDPMTVESLSVRWINTWQVLVVNPITFKVRWIDDWNAFSPIVAGMQLAAEWSGLDAATVFPT